MASLDFVFKDILQSEFKWDSKFYNKSSKDNGKRKPRVKDLYGRTIPTEEEFPALKNAPRFVRFCFFCHFLKQYIYVLSLSSDIVFTISGFFRMFLQAGKWCHWKSETFCG